MEVYETIFAIVFRCFKKYFWDIKLIVFNAFDNFNVLLLKIKKYFNIFLN
jgi:hypothetical protein